MWPLCDRYYVQTTYGRYVENPFSETIELEPQLKKEVDILSRLSNLLYTVWQRPTLK